MVVLLPRGEGEEAEDDTGPEEQSEAGFVDAEGHEDAIAGDGSRVRARCAVAEVFDGADDGCRQERNPGKEPEDEQEPEERDGDLAVVVRDAAAEEAGDVLVVEIEPGPAGFAWEAEAGGHRDGWVAERGEDVPGERDHEEDEG